MNTPLQDPRATRLQQGISIRVINDDQRGPVAASQRADPGTKHSPPHIDPCAAPRSATSRPPHSITVLVTLGGLSAGLLIYAFMVVVSTPNRKRGLTDESEILKFLQHGTLVGLLPVPHPILIRKYQANAGTAMWFRTYMWGVIYLRNMDPPIWYDTDVKLFEIQRV